MKTPTEAKTCDAHAITTFQTEHTDAFGERSFVYWRDSSAAKQTLPLFFEKHTVNALLPTDWFYFSGISLAILSEDDRETLFGLLTQLKAQGVKVAFDPNYRPVLWQSVDSCREAFIAAYRLADLALPGLDDHQVLFGARSCDDVITQLRELGTSEIVVKNGKDGAWVFSDNEPVARHTPAVPVKKVVDTTAAGDSFNGGYLAARLAGRTPQQAASLAAALAAFVVEHTGAIVSLDNFRSFKSRYPL